MKVNEGSDADPPADKSKPSLTPEEEIELVCGGTIELACIATAVLVASVMKK